MKIKTRIMVSLLLIFLSLTSSYAFFVTNTINVGVTVIEAVDTEPPLVSNVYHTPLYPTSNETISFYANVTDNVAVANVELNYTENGGTTWLLKEMPLSNGSTYSTSLGNYSQGQILGFYIVAYDTSGNVGYGSEIVPPLPEPPRVAPILVSDQLPNPLPDGKDISYDTNDNGTEIYANVTEIGIYDPTAMYNITYSIDGGLTWITRSMLWAGGDTWRYLIEAWTNILFKIVKSDGSAESRTYWIIVGPWKYPIYLYFSQNEPCSPVEGLDFDGDNNVSNNWINYSYDRNKYDNEFLSNDLDNDGVRDVWSYAYMNPKTLDDGCLVVEYWVYYAFNYYPILTIKGTDVFNDNHEHDFESVYLWIDLATGNIKKLACSQHQWINHYLFDVNNPPKKINLGVEEGGHGMALLEDLDRDGEPDLNDYGYYSVVPGVDWMENEEMSKPNFLNPSVICPSSYIAQIHPWVIYDPRINSSELHLFDDPSTLTTGLSFDAIGLSILPAVVSEIPEYYGYLGNLLSVNCLLKTTFGVTGRDEYRLTYYVIAPLYRQEFKDASRMWRKVSFGWWPAKELVKLATPFIVAGLLGYFGVAVALGIIVGKAVGFLTSYVLKVNFDPVEGVISDYEGHVLGYSESPNDLPLGYVLATRNSTNGLYDLFLIMTNSSDEYIYDVKGIADNGIYSFSVSRSDIHGSEITFNSVEIPIHVAERERYVINWTLLEAGLTGVEVFVDTNADGVFERHFQSDSLLTANEFRRGVLPGDVNVDGIVDIFDAILLANAFGKSTGEAGYNADADLRLDGIVDIFDAIILANHYNQHYP